MTNSTFAVNADDDDDVTRVTRPSDWARARLTEREKSAAAAVRDWPPFSLGACPSAPPSASLLRRARGLLPSPGRPPLVPGVYRRRFFAPAVVVADSHFARFTADAPTGGREEFWKKGKIPIKFRKIPLPRRFGSGCRVWRRRFASLFPSHLPRVWV